MLDGDLVYVYVFRLNIVIKIDVKKGCIDII